MKNNNLRMSHLTIDEMIEKLRNKSNMPSFQFTLDLSTARTDVLLPYEGGQIQCIDETNRDYTAYCYISPTVPNNGKRFALGTRLVTPYTGLYFTNTAQAGKKLTFEVSNEFTPIFRYDFFFDLFRNYLSDTYVPYTGALKAVDLGAYGYTGAKLNINGNADQVHATIKENAIQTSDIFQILASDGTTQRLTFSASKNLTIFKNSLGSITSPSGGITLSNIETSTSTVPDQDSPPLVFTGNTYYSGSNKLEQWALFLKSVYGGNRSDFYFYYKDGSSSWIKHAFNLTGGGTAGGGVELKIPTTNSFYSTFAIQTTSVATLNNQKYSPGIKFSANGWKTGGTPAGLWTSIGMYNTPEQGSTYPIGVFKFCYNNDSLSPLEANEIFRMEWGDRLGAIFNDLSQNGYIFRVETDSHTHAIATIPADNGVGLSAPPAVPTLPANSMVTFSLDETSNLLVFTVKYSDGTVKTGSVAVA